MSIDLAGIGADVHLLRQRDFTVIVESSDRYQVDNKPLDAEGLRAKAERERRLMSGSTPPAAPGGALSPKKTRRKSTPRAPRTSKLLTLEQLQRAVDQVARDLDALERRLGL